MKFVKSNHRATLKYEHFEELICTASKHTVQIVED